jgi:hypothetical protein
MKTEKIKITKSDLSKCEEFALGSAGTSLDHYARRGQNNGDKIITDIITGKLGEIAVYRYLRKKGIMATAPDFKIYDKRRKSFDADINYGKWNFHCKSQNQDSARKYGVSWILQYGGNGNGHVDKLFKNRGKYDILVPTLVHDDYVEIFGLISVDKLFEYDMIKKPKVKWLEFSKRAVYKNDLEKLNYYYRWKNLEKL